MVDRSVWLSVDAVDRSTLARRGRLHTKSGTVETPAFMPVGTQATVKGLLIENVRAAGAEMILANTYHLMVRPGEDVVQSLGGLHAMTGWQGPILTDSGGFQIFSLADRAKIDEQGVRFQSHVDGRAIELTPERAMEVQRKLGPDVMMALDHVVALPASDEAVRLAAERTVRWAERCKDALLPGDPALFAIVQGGLDPALRTWCAERLAAIDFPGYAIGGLSVGESPEEMYRVLDGLAPAMPVDKPRYLMGVGRPQDLLEAIARGVDMFDCVMPTRNGRNALAFTDDGPVRLRNLIHQSDRRPLEANCPCAACRHSRGYLRHLFQAKEMLGPILLSIHNLAYYQRLLAAARQAISQGEFATFYKAKIARMSANQGDAP